MKAELMVYGKKGWEFREGKRATTLVRKNWWRHQRNEKKEICRVRPNCSIDFKRGRKGDR